MPTKIKIAGAAFFVIVAVLSLIFALAWDILSDKEVHEDLSKKDDIPVNLAEAESNSAEYAVIAQLFGAAIPVAAERKPLAEPVKTLAPAAVPLDLPKNIPVLRYVGFIEGEDGTIIFYIKDETHGRMLRVGKGVNDDGVVFISSDDEKIVLEIEGQKVVVYR